MQIHLIAKLIFIVYTKNVNVRLKYLALILNVIAEKSNIN